MFSTTTITVALLLTSTTVNAIPIWSRFSAALAVRQQPDGNATTPIQIAQGSNFFFDSLRLDDPCTTGQVGCISSSLATCSPESNWEISPCTSNTTCLAVPASDTTGIFVGCLVFQDAQALLAGQNVSVDFGITSPPNGTATEPTFEVPIQTETGSASATPTDDPTDSSSDPAAPTDAPTDSSSDSVDPTDSDSDPAPTDEPTSTDDSSDPAPTDDPTDSSSDSSDPTSTDSPVDPTATDSPVDPTATCTDDAPGSESTEYETITVVIQPNPTGLPGQLTTVTLSPSDSADPTSTDTNTTSTDTSTDPTSTDTDSPSPDVTGTDGAVPTSIPEPDATDPAPTGNSTCTEDPSATEDPTDSPDPTDSSTDPAPTDSISTDYGALPTNSSSSSSASTTTAQQTGLTLTVPPNFSIPTPTSTDTDTPANNVAPAPSGSPDVSVVGTHVIPASPSPARMVRVRRSWD